MKREKIDWSKWDHLLGTMTDRALSKQVECSPQAVTLRRNKLGIPSVRTARLESGNLRERRNATAQYNSKAAIGQANPEVVAELAELAGKMYSIKDIAGYLGATVRTVQGYLKNGKLKGVKIGGGWKVSAENFQKFMRGE
ncbi:MAG: helix-turn-helix domain-containing protein [Synergistaceae bacterium]|jgi:excisionase family DNA binding protein|nr:helix-turn-helix domain-containing protein [Synergistaceae bacterium]